MTTLVLVSNFWIAVMMIFVMPMMKEPVATTFIVVVNHRHMFNLDVLHIRIIFILIFNFCCFHCNGSKLLHARHIEEREK